MTILTIFLLLFYFDVFFTRYHIGKTNISSEKNPIHKFFYRAGLRKGLILALSVYSIISISIIWMWFNPIYHTEMALAIKFFLIPLFSVVALLNILYHFGILQIIRKLTLDETCKILQTIFLGAALLIAYLGLQEVEKITIDIEEIRANRFISPNYIVGNETSNAAIYWNGTCLIQKAGKTQADICP